MGSAKKIFHECYKNFVVSFSWTLICPLQLRSSTPASLRQRLLSISLFLFYPLILFISAPGAVLTTFLCSFHQGAFLSLAYHFFLDFWTEWLSDFAAAVYRQVEQKEDFFVCAKLCFSIRSGFFRMDFMFSGIATQSQQVGDARPPGVRAGQGCFLCTISWELLDASWKINIQMNYWCAKSYLS